MEEKKLRCQDCGTGREVVETTCPYADDVLDEKIDIVVCLGCLHERAMDI